jgi:hypothetical protein
MRSERKSGILRLTRLFQAPAALIGGAVSFKPLTVEHDLTLQITDGKYF